jgi:hypothetical protein
LLKFRKRNWTSTDLATGLCQQVVHHRPQLLFLLVLQPFHESRMMILLGNDSSAISGKPMGCVSSVVTGFLVIISARHRELSC